MQITIVIHNANECGETTPPFNFSYQICCPHFAAGETIIFLCKKKWQE